LGQTNKRPNNGTVRLTGPKQDRVNHLALDEGSLNEDEYIEEAERETEDIDDETADYCSMLYAK